MAEPFLLTYAELLTQSCSDTGVIHSCYVYLGLEYEMRLNTLNKTLNDEKRIAELKDGRNKLVISYGCRGTRGIYSVWCANIRMAVTGYRIYPEL